MANVENVCTDKRLFKALNISLIVLSRLLGPLVVNNPNAAAAATVASSRAYCCCETNLPIVNGSCILHLQLANLLRYNEEHGIVD